MRALSFEIPTNKQTNKDISMDEACKRRSTAASVMLRGLRFHLLCGHDRKPLGCKTCSPITQVHQRRAPRYAWTSKFCLVPSETPFCTPWLQPVVIWVTVAFLRSLKQTVCPFTSDPPRHQQGYFPPHNWPLQDIFLFWDRSLETLEMVDHGRSCRKSVESLPCDWLIGWSICVNCTMNIVLAGTGRRVWKWSIP